MCPGARWPVIKRGGTTIFAYIPARGGSRRIPGKNVRPLGGKPIIGHVIETLKTLPFVRNVHVSTDDPDIAAVAEDFGADCLAPRTPQLAADAPGFIDLIHDDLGRYSDANDGDREVLFVLATAALVPRETFEDANKLYERERPDLLMSCERFHISPYWALRSKADGFLEPLFPDFVLINSQDLPPTLGDAGLFYFFNIDTMARFTSVKLVDKLLPYLIADDYACDVDTPEDWKVLERKYVYLDR